MNEHPSNNEENLRQEFETLGRNLVGAMRAAWDSPESRRLREEMVNGLTELGVTLRREADNLSTSQAAQQVKNGVEQVGERLRTTDVPTKVRGELVNALQMVNGELQKIIDRWAEQPTPAAGTVVTPAESGSTGSGAVAYDTVPGLADEDPFAQSVPPDNTIHPSATPDTQSDDPVI